MNVDVAIFGGGIAGLWLLDELRRAGYAVVLLETQKLGSGQTVCSQGIIHGGLKYTLDGVFRVSADSVAQMPELWRECFAGRREPDLREAKLRADYCHLWRTDDWRSKLGMLGARSGLRVRPVKLPRPQWPAVLRESPGTVFRLAEPVFDPGSVLATLAKRCAPRVLRIAAEEAPRFACAGEHAKISVAHPRQPANVLKIDARLVVLAAGAGNAALRAAAGLDPHRMQRRPLHMVMVRGAREQLELFNGHCTDGAHTRVTITAAEDGAGRVVWQLGGQIAEDGVTMEFDALIERAKAELAATMPGLLQAGLEWATYSVDRAERATPGAKRPNDVTVDVEGPFITAWPTKLALAPRLARMVMEQLPDPAHHQVNESATIDQLPADWPEPQVADPPWKSAEWSE